MKRIISGFLCAVICACVFCACSNEGGFSPSETLSGGYTRSESLDRTYNFEDGASEPPASYNTYSELITSYCLRLLRAELDTAQGSSVCRSPLGAALLLSQLSGGMNGGALEELQLALGSGLDSDALNQCSSYLKSRLQSVSRMYFPDGDGKDGDGKDGDGKDGGAYVKLGSYLLINSDKDVISAFLQSNADFYGSGIYRFDFGSDSSKEKLQALFGEDFPDCSGDMAAVFGTELSDGWLTPYSAESSVKGEFRGSKGSAEKTFLCSSLNSLSSKKARAVISYTAQTPLKVMFILPNEGISLEEYVKAFDGTEYSSLLDSFSVTDTVSAEIPEFSVKAPAVTKLNDALEQSGLHLLFSGDSGFSRLAHNDLSLTDFYELGSKLSFTAEGIGSPRSAAAIAAPTAQAPEENDSTELEKLRFDRPFLCVVLDNESNIPVLVSTVCE